VAIPIYLYANGNDPFIFPLGDFIVHVYAGPPPGEESIITSPTVSSPVAEPDPAPVTSRLVVFPRKTRVGPPIGLTYIQGSDEMREWFNSVELEHSDQPVRFRLDTLSGPSRLGIETLLDGLRGLDGHDVNVEIVGWSEPGDG
jgi:hypothetical protein